MNNNLIDDLREVSYSASQSEMADLLHEAADALEAKAAPVGEREDDRAAIHQLAFELGGTEGGEYLLDADDLNAVIDAAYQRQQARVEVMPDVVEFAVSRWEAEVKHRPLVNVHRRALDGTWRQIIRFAGGDPDELCGPDHDTLIARLNKGGSHELGRFRPNCRSHRRHTGRGEQVVDK